MAALGNKISLAVGEAIKLNTAAIAGVGTLDFSIAARDQCDFSLLFQAVGTVTTLTCSLQVSLDGGTTFVDYVLAANFLTSTGPVLQKAVTPAFAGTWRINITAATGATDIWVVLN